MACFVRFSYVVGAQGAGCLRAADGCGVESFGSGLRPAALSRAFRIGSKPAERTHERTRNAGLRCERLRPADGCAIEPFCLPLRQAAALLPIRPASPSRNRNRCDRPAAERRRQRASRRVAALRPGAAAGCRTIARTRSDRSLRSARVDRCGPPLREASARRRLRRRTLRHAPPHQASPSRRSPTAPPLLFRELEDLAVLLAFAARLPRLEPLLAEAVVQADRNREVVERRAQRRGRKAVDRPAVLVAVAQDVRVAEVVAGAQVDFEASDEHRGAAAPTRP